VWKDNVFGREIKALPCVIAFLSGFHGFRKMDSFVRLVAVAMDAACIVTSPPP
jgi:hypothetical protein